MRKVLPSVRCALSFIAAVGCSGHVEDDPGAARWSSGERLRARYLDGGDGATSHLGWYDQELETRCAFRVAEDGSQRCLPELVGSVAYGDAACTKPIAIVSRCAAGAAWLAVSLPEEALDACAPFDAAEPPAAAFRVLGESSTSETYVLDGSRCSSTGPVGPESVALEVEPAAPDVFVSATERREATSDGLEARVWEGDDGSRMVFGFWDTTRVEACHFDTDFAPEDRCVPAPGWDAAYESDVYFADPSCTDALATYHGNCPGPGLIYGSERVDCESVSVLRTVSEAHEGAVYTSMGGCHAVEADWGQTHEAYALGLDVSSTFPPGSVSRLGSGRLKVLGRSVGAVSSTTDRGLVDSRGEVVCTPLSVAGTIRCVPRQTPQVRAYADPECTLPLAEWYFTEAGCEAPAPAFAATPSFDECSTTAATSLHQLGATWSGPLFELGNNGCEPYGGRLNSLYFVLGDEIDAAMFPELRERIE